MHCITITNTTEYTHYAINIPYYFFHTITTVHFFNQIIKPTNALFFTTFIVAFCPLTKRGQKATIKVVKSTAFVGLII
jgi:hypothetical protein